MQVSAFPGRQDRKHNQIILLYCKATNLTSSPLQSEKLGRVSFSTHYAAADYAFYYLTHFFTPSFIVILIYHCRKQGAMLTYLDQLFHFNRSDFLTCALCKLFLRSDVPRSFASPIRSRLLWFFTQTSIKMKCYQDEDNFSALFSYMEMKIWTKSSNLSSNILLYWRDNVFSGKISYAVSRSLSYSIS